MKLIFMGNFTFNGEAILLSNLTVGKIYDVEILPLLPGSLFFIGDDSKKFSISSHFITEGYFVKLDVYREIQLEKLTR